VGLLNAQVELVKLGSADDTDNRAIFDNAGEVSLVGFGIVLIAFEAVSIVFEGVFLGSVPVLVESALDITFDVASEDSGKSTESTRSRNVADATDDSHGWAFNDRGSVDNILLDDLLTLSTLLELDSVGHTCLVAHEGGQMDWLASIVLGPVSDTAAMVLSSSLGKIGE
jgi:hypothetical protein